MTKQKHSIADCLLTLEVVPEATKDAAAAVFDDCTNLEEEFKIIKKAYFKKVLECHPDKGGDEEQFRHVQTSFEVVRVRGILMSIFRTTNTLILVILLFPSLLPGTVPKRTGQERWLCVLLYNQRQTATRHSRLGRYF